MSDPLQYLLQHGPMLLAGSSLLLAVGTIAVFVQRSPVHRQRSGELTALAVLVWLLLANVPMPRLSLEHWMPTETGDRTRQLSAQQPRTEGLAEPDETRDNTEFVVVTSDESAGAVAQYQQDFVMPKPDAAVERLELELQATTPVEPAAVAALPALGAPIHYANWLAVVFLTGTGVCISWLLLGRVLLWRMLRTSGRPDDWLLELYRTLPCRRRPELLISQRAGRAFSFGLVRPVIVLPEGCCSVDKVDQLRAVLLHELAHSEQGDAWGRLLFNAAFPLLYFHPLYWVIRRRTFMSAELIADDRAAAQTSRASYTRELIALVRANGGVRFGHLGAMPVFVSGTRFFRRMEMLMRRESRLPYHCTPSRRAVYAVLFVIVVVVSGGLFGIEPILAQTGRDIAEESTTGEDEARAATDEVEARATDEGLTEQSVTDYEAAKTIAKPGTVAVLQLAQQTATSQPKPKKNSKAEQDKTKKDATQNEKANLLQQVVQHGTAFLRTAQRADGTWPTKGDHQRVGTTALCTLALLKAGAKATDAHIQKALSALRKADPKMTYGIALQTLVFCAAEPKKDLALIQRNVGLLEASQIADGTRRGGWGYSGPEALVHTNGDNSNSGFAIWALDEAAHAGAKVKRQTWDRALSHWRKGQRQDGSWGYVNKGSAGTGSMTCTGIASLAVCLNRKPAEEVTKEEIDALDRGIVWLKENFAVDNNPGSKSWILYYLMELRRAGELTGVRRIGDHNWYSDLADFLLKKQQPRDGSWNDRGRSREVSTALALLALQTGPPPQLAAEADRTWGVEGRVVDELNEPVVDGTIIVRWALGGQPRHSRARTDQQGHFALVSPPTYVNIEWMLAVFDDDIGARPKVIERKPIVLQVPRFRLEIQGIWKVVSWQQAGRKEKPDDIRNAQVFVTKNKITVWNGDERISEETYTIDPAVKPQQIDLAANDKKARGIFRLQQGNRLTLCLDRAGRGRPSKFASEIDSPNEYLIELERYGTKEIKRIKGVDAPANWRIAAALREQTELEFFDTSLSDGLQFISDLHAIDVDLDQAGLKKAGVDPTTPLRIKVRGVKLHVVLEMLLRPLKLRYELRDGRLVVTSRRDETARANRLPSATRAATYRRSRRMAQRTGGTSASPSAPRAAAHRSKSVTPAVSAGTGKSLDLIQLATAYIDAVGAMELAQLRMKNSDRLVASRVVAKIEAETARLKVKTAERKVTLLKAIVEQEIEATREDRKVAENQLKIEQALVKKGYATHAPSESRIRQLEGRLRTLQLILKQ